MCAHCPHARSDALSHLHAQPELAFSWARSQDPKLEYALLRLTEAVFLPAAGLTESYTRQEKAALDGWSARAIAALAFCYSHADSVDLPRLVKLAEERTGDTIELMKRHGTGRYVWRKFAIWRDAFHVLRESLKAEEYDMSRSARDALGLYFAVEASAIANGVIPRPERSVLGRALAVEGGSTHALGASCGRTLPLKILKKPVLGST